MQVARMQSPGRRGYLRKSIEALTALFLTVRYGREAILLQYLQLVPYGNRIHGIAYAARRYLDKPMEDLSWAETAFLTALPQAPGRMNPFDPAGRAAAIDRGRRILKLLLEKGALPPEEYTLALVHIEGISVPPREKRPLAALHPVLRLQQELGDSAKRQALAHHPILDTTLDLDLQERVERLASSSVRAWEGRGAGNAAVIVLDPSTREVLAWVASAGYFDDRRAGAIDYTRVPRSPGSVLKPFIFALALERGVITPSTILDDLHRGAGGIGNSDERFLGPLLPRVALANSRNVPAADLLVRLGLDEGGAFLRELELDDGEIPPERYGVGLVIGGMPVTLERLARAYEVLADGGRLADLAWFRGVPALAPAPPRRILSESTSRQIALFLSDPLARLPSFPRMGATEYPFPVAVKTGTSSNYRDAWTVAWSHRALVAAWVGHPESRPMDHLSGIASAAGLVKEIMLLLHPLEADGQEDHSFPAPRGYLPRRVCALTGDLATPACSEIFLEWFRPGQEPVQPCAAHQRVAVDARTGLPAGPSTVPDALEVRDYVTLPPRYAAWAEKAGLSRPPAGAALPARIGGPRIRIISPENGVRFLRDPEMPAALTTLALQAVVDPPASRIVWYVDGSPYRTVRYPYATRWPLRPGSHIFEARAPRGGAFSPAVRITVQ
jgi:penicillin-binding protein 1C